eukprot:gene17954-21384_t
MREEVTVPNYLNKFNAPPGHIIIDLQFDLNALRVENVLFRLEAELAPPPHAYPFSEDVPPLRVLSERALFGAFKAEAIAEKDCIHKQRSRLREKYESKVLEEYTTARTALKSTREYQDVLCLRKQLREAEDRLEQRELKILHTVTRRDAVVQSQYCREEDALWSRGDRLLEQHQRQETEDAGLVVFAATIDMHGSPFWCGDTADGIAALAASTATHTDIQAIMAAGAVACVPSECT